MISCPRPYQVAFFPPSGVSGGVLLPSGLEKGSVRKDDCYLPGHLIMSEGEPTGTGYA